LITGGSSGIGLALAKELLRLHNTVIVCGRDQEKLDAVRHQHPEIHTIQCDVADAEDVARVVDTLRKEHPRLNMIVNNAGVQHRYDLATGEDVLARVDQEIGVNLTAVIKLTHLLLPVLSRQPKAAVVNISSLLGLIPKKSSPVYCATKAAVHAFTKALRYQLAGTTVRVFEVVPPLVDTGMAQGQPGGKITPEALVQEVVQSIRRDRYEVRVGRAKGLMLLDRFFPALMERLVGGK
jgi:short-subunit dehydrogenase involved in D-alanine esterification of teichoic acids